MIEETIIDENQQQEQQQEPVQQDPPIKKLWENLHGAEYYTKSFDDFKKQFSTPESISKLHKSLAESEYYTKGEGEFMNQFFPDLKKKRTSSVGSGLQDGGLESTTSTIPPTTPKKATVIVGETTEAKPKDFTPEIPEINLTVLTSDGELIPLDNTVALSKKVGNLMKQTNVPRVTGGTGGAGVSFVLDEKKLEEANKLKAALKERGFDATEIMEQYKYVPDDIAKKPGFRPEDKTFNPQMYYRKLGAASWQPNLKSAVDVWEKMGDISTEDAAKVKELIYNSTIPGKTYSQRRQITADLSAALSSYIPDEEKRKRLIKNLATDRSISYGVLSPEDKQVIENSPERQYLDFDQTLAYQYLQDTDPEIAKGYKDLFVSDKALDAEGNARAGWQFKASRLKSIGLQIQQSALQEQMNNLWNTEGELFTPEQEAKYIQLIAEYDRLKLEADQIPVKYPFPAQYNAVQNAQEILGSQLIEKGGVVGSPLWLLGKTSESIVNTGKGILDLAGEAVNGSESEASKVQRMAVLGEQKMLESIYQIPQKDQAMKSFEVVTSPEIKSQIDAIKNDKNLSYDDKLKKIVDIQIKNPGAISRLPIHNGKLDINPTTMFYAAGELASAIVPYIGLEAITGGGATAGLARKFASSFNAAFLTGFRDAYAAAIDKGVDNPYTYAIRNTAINSLAMAGAGTPQMIKQLAGTKSAIGQVINNMSNKSIQEMIDIGNKSISLFGKSIKTRPLVNAATAVGEKALEGMGGFTKFEAAMLPAKVLNKKLNDEEINPEEMLKESVVMIATGGIVGLTGARERYKQLNDIDKGGYLKAAENPQAHIETAQKMLVDGLMTREDYDKAVSNIKLASEVSGRTKFVDNNGNELSQKKKADLLLLKMQEAELQKQTMGDVPDKLREKVRQENEELKSEMDKVYESEVPEQQKQSGITEISSEEVKPQIGEVVRTETNQPVSEVAEIPEGQGTKETVSEGSNAVGQGKSEATTTVLSEREVVPTEKSTEGKEVELPVTKSGLTEVEREKLIQEREKKTAIPEKDKETQDILNDISKYNKLPNGRLGKLKPEGLKSLNKIREKVRAFNDKHGTNYSFDDRAGKLYDKNKKGLTGAVKGKNVYDPDSGIDRSGKPLRERDKDVIDAFDQLMEVGALPTGYGTDGRRMSSSQLDATVQDILDGVPSRRANNYLDALEKMVREDDFDFSQPDFQQTNRISLADIVGIEKETATEPMTEEQVDKWLEDESQMTREDERLFDNIENLINEYEIENGFEREVEQPPATTETTVSAETKPNEKSGSTAAESTGTGKESGKVESPESEKPGAGEGAPPNEPPNEKASTAFEEQKRTTFSHKGIQEVATEYGLDDVTSRERVSDLELFRRADETISKWVSEGSYRRNINDLLQRSKEGEILPTPEQNIIIAQHIAQLRGAAEKARKEFGVNSKEYNDALTELQDVSSVGAKIRSDIGAALRVPNLSRTYMQTLEDAMVTKMDAVGADVLTESQKREVEEQFEKIKIEKERFETLYNEAVTKNNELAAENELLKIQKDKKAVFGVKRDYKAHRQSLKEQLKNEVEKYKQEGNKMGISSDGGMKSFEISVKMAEIIMKILKSHVEEAGAKLADVTKRTFEDVKDLFEGITENDIRDVIAGVYSKKEKTLTQLQADMKDVQAEAKLLNELDRVMQGVPKNEKQEKEKNRKLFELKKQIDALKKESGLDQYSDEAKIKRAILSIKRQEEKIRERINSKDYSKEEKKKGVFDNPEFKRKYPDLYKKLLDAYTAKEEAQHEFDIALAKDEYEKMSKMGKVFDFGDKALNTTKKLVTGIDLSAMGIQGLFAILRRPVVGGIALKESFLDLASKKRFERKIAEIHNSGIYDLMQKSGLDITEPKSLLAKEKEEIFSGQTLDINVKYKGKSYKIIEPLFAPFERAFTSLGNNLRAIAFSTIAEKYMKEGNTFENNPKLFKDLAKMLNTETGRGEQNQYLQRASEFVTKGIWSPRLMASRLNLLGVSDAIALVTGRKLGTKGYYSQLSPEMRIEAAKSVGQFMLSVYALSYLAAYALGGDLDDEPDSSTFMDIKVGDKSYNLTGGFSQYVKLVAQSVRGGRKIEGDFREFKGEKSVLTNFGHFMRGKLTPASGVLADVLSGMKDYSNRPVTASDEITKLTIPLSLRDTKNQMEKDGLSSIFSHILPSFIGINVKDKRDYETNDLSVKEFKFLYDKGVRLPQTLQENLKVENSKGEEVKVSDADFEKFKNEKNKIIQGYVKKIMDKGYPKMVNGFPKIVPAKELDTEELQDAMDRYSRKATKQAKEKIFGVKQKSIEDKISDRVLESAIKGWEKQ